MRKKRKKRRLIKNKKLHNIKTPRTIGVLLYWGFTPKNKLLNELLLSEFRGVAKSRVI
jgi:hypothetical protein